ncbi:MAG TPA: hypothetical protein VFM82_11645 [Flavobacteriaceae bacterium]|nr:hypothetical protein [Flavobacteriaceae bacterium]
MKRIVFVLCIICLMFVPRVASAQDLVQYSVSDSLENLAKNRTAELSQHLGLTAKQALLFEDKLIEFYGYENTVNNLDISMEQKKKKLGVLAIRKAEEMRDILTDIQYDLYLEMLSSE